MFNIFNDIEVPKYLQRSPWLEPLSLQSLGAPTDATRNWFSAYRAHHSNIAYLCAFYDPRKSGLMYQFAQQHKLSDVNYKIEDWRYPKASASSRDVWTRMRLDEMDPAVTKKHDQKIEKLISSALAHNDAELRVTLQVKPSTEV